VDVLKKLVELGAEVLSPTDDKRMAPLDYAAYFRQTGCVDYLRGLGGKGYTTEYERLQR
jgi:hypothetical protein